MGGFGWEAELADYSATQTLLGILAAIVLWTLIYAFFCLLNSKQSYEWNCRIVSSLHAIIVIGATFWSGCVQGPFPFTHPGGPNTKMQHWICVLCLGYFIYDLVWCLYFNTEGAVMLFHHLLSVYGQFIILLLGHDGVEMMAVLFGSEFSNPFLQLRWFLREANKHRTWLGEINDHLFMFTFGFWRILVGAVLLYCTLSHPLPPLHAKLGGLAIYLLGWVFWVMIVNYAIRKYKKKFKARNEKELNDSKKIVNNASQHQNGTILQHNGSGNSTAGKRHSNGSNIHPTSHSKME